MDENELRCLIGKRLRLARYTAELTQDQLGEAAGVPRSFISLIEHGAPPSMDIYRLRRLALAVGTTLVALLDEGTVPPPVRPVIHSGQEENSHG